MRGNKATLAKHWRARLSPSIPAEILAFSMTAVRDTPPITSLPCFADHLSLDSLRD